MFDSFISWLMGTIADAAQAFIGMALNCLNMDLTTFVSYFPVAATLYVILQSVAIGFLFAFAAWNLGKFLTGHLANLTESPVQIIVMSGMSAFLIFFGNYILQTVINVFSYPYADILAVDATHNSFSFETIQEATTTGALALIAPGASTAVAAVGIVLIIIIILLGYQILALLFEMIERWIMLGVLVYTSPLAWATIVSSNTRPMFQKWLNMFLSQCLLLLINAWSVKMLFSIMSYPDAGVMSIALALCFCKVARQLDTYLKQIGLNPAGTGRSLLDDIETAYENMSGGTYGIAYQPLDGNSQTYAINYGDVVECGDWINLFVAGAYYDKLVNEEWPEDLTVEVYQMITENNVDARMKIIDSIGLDAVNEFAYNNSCTDTQINNSSLAAGSPDTTSIKDVARMLRKIQDKTFVNEEVSNTILTMLENHTANDIFGRDLPSGIKVCEITSKGSGYVGSAALIYEEDKCYLLCMFGANVSDVDQAEARFASLAKDIYDFNHQLQGATNNGAGGLMNVEFSKTYFEDHPFYFSDRFNYIDEESNILYWMKKATKYGRDQDYMLQYSWNAYSKVIERTTAFEDDIYFDLIENSAEYANITLDTSNGLGGANGSYGDGSSLAQVAEQEYQNYGGTACGNRYWPSGPEAWCVDFVYWCAQQCGYVGSGQIFGTFVHNVSDEAINLQNAGATIYYPGDGTIPQPGDIIMFWDDKGRPGTAADGVPVNQGLLCHTGIVVEGTSSTVTIVEGNCGSSNPANSVLKKNTYSLTGASWGNTYICCFARPNYPTRVFDTSSRATIQNALITLLYNGQSGGVVTCDFDGYVNTPGRHEGIDIARGAGSPIYSIMSGEIIGVNRGSDSGLLSTIFVYDATRNKTVCYMHCAPRSDLYVGNRIAVGDSLGTEASRGAGGAHTHIEVINGRSLYAMKSVNDYVLENEDPYPYWASVLGGR